MKPVVCFHQNQQLIYSDDYLVKSTFYNVTHFLENIENEYFEKMKIVQIDFEATGATVFILNTYRLISPSDIESNEKINPVFKPAISKKLFSEKVLRIKNDIAAGRYYQVNFTSSFKSEIAEDSFLVFQKYLSVFKSEYSAFLPMQEFEILCYSPELFLEKTDALICTRPIKGTLTTSLNQLIASPKETAELSMIVDLLRNDLNSICEKPVTVTKHREILNLGYTQHTYSEICGQTNLHLPEILNTTFPGGSISGCPKSESLLAISEIENLPRGFYTGTIGWWKNNDFKLNIAIRSFKKENTDISYYAGCGIVYDSEPEFEWQEFLTKAGKLTIHHD